MKKLIWMLTLLFSVTMLWASSGITDNSANDPPGIVVSIDIDNVDINYEFVAEHNRVVYSIDYYVPLAASLVELPGELYSIKIYDYNEYVNLYSRQDVYLKYQPPLMAITQPSYYNLIRYKLINKHRNLSIVYRC